MLLWNEVVYQAITNASQKKTKSWDMFCNHYRSISQFLFQVLAAIEMKIVYNRIQRDTGHEWARELPMKREREEVREGPKTKGQKPKSTEDCSQLYRGPLHGIEDSTMEFGWGLLCVRLSWHLHLELNFHTAIMASSPWCRASRCIVRK